MHIRYLVEWTTLYTQPSRLVFEHTISFQVDAEHASFMMRLYVTCLALYQAETSRAHAKTSPAFLVAPPHLSSRARQRRARPDRRYRLAAAVSHVHCRQPCRSANRCRCAKALAGLKTNCYSICSCISKQMFAYAVHAEEPEAASE